MPSARHARMNETENLVPRIASLPPSNAGSATIQRHPFEGFQISSAHDAHLPPMLDQPATPMPGMWRLRRRANAGSRLLWADAGKNRSWRSGCARLYISPRSGAVSRSAGGLAAGGFPGTRPRPVFCTAHQTGRHRVRLHVRYHRRPAPSRTSPSDRNTLSARRPPRSSPGGGWPASR